MTQESPSMLLEFGVLFIYAQFVVPGSLSTDEVGVNYVPLNNCVANLSMLLCDRFGTRKGCG
jgi:hypothetical protein